MDDINLESYVKEGIDARSKIDIDQVKKFADTLYGCMKSGGKLIVFGNGGSAADSQHFAAELTGHFTLERRPFPAIALNANTSALTAIGNDYSFDDVFSRQVEAFAKSGDVVVGISTSGNSMNVIRAIEAANRIGAYTVGMTGRSGGKLRPAAKEMFMVESDSTPIIQEVHIAIIHMICMEFDRLHSNSKK